MAKIIDAFQDWLMVVAVVIFSLAAPLKLLAPVMVKLRLIDSSSAVGMPESLRIAAALVEFGLVLVILSKTISKSAKLSALFVVGIALVVFRLLSFGTLFPQDCGCFGSLHAFSASLGRAFEAIASVFVILLPLGFLSQLFVKPAHHNDP